MPSDRDEPQVCRICRGIGAPFHRAVSVVMDATGCDDGRVVAAVLWALINAGWTAPDA
jgi:hypothetical protein